MKTSIPSDVWEKKKALIAKLYKDEEWPLKQVIKKIRSDNFNPSETQLRSRLKKWRVTKPSRQTRKKSHDGHLKTTDDDSGNDGASPKTQTSSVSPRTPLHATQQPAMRAFPVTEPEWYMSHGVYVQSQRTSAPVFTDNHAVSAAWPLPAGQQPSPSPSEHHSSHNGSPVAMPVPNAYHQPHISPAMDKVFVNATSTMTHAFSGPPFAVTTESCMPEQVSTTAVTAPIQWTVPHWYPLPPGAISQSPPVHFYPPAPPSPPSTSPVDPAMHAPYSQADFSIYSPNYPGPSQHQVSENFNGISSWKRAMSLQYTPDTMARHSRDERPEDPNYADRKTSLPSKMSSHSSGLMTPPSQFFPHGQHPMMCGPIYSYPDPDPLLHRPPSIEF
ncbi:Clr5 domain-containing protein [Aspergillus thermomutatus]|uniref:Clr5 domain-containing protein n=1 Tax=Aspergillus thermomutatus TaxID=41047 RepID=A0A397HFC5_ASPTH|nr:uncharacterized protein CDV56_103817 [Aspergillus thermomutatus]RHZ60728.1 hypothetical protein CDV56_103817 [Aspergillus thermomutatus]